MMTDSNGKFVWYELMTSDHKAAASFYRDVIGWETTDSGMTDRSYAMLSVGPAMVGGLMPIPDEARAMGARPGWCGYIGVDDVDAYATRVKAAGGAIYRAPDDIPGVGRFAAVGDPHGAMFVLFTGSSDLPPYDAAATAPGHIGWHELHSGDLDTAFAFYSKLFGWTKADAVDMGPMGIYQMFATGGAPVGGMMTKAPEVPKPFWLYYFNVDAVDAVTERAVKGGGKVLSGPHQVPGGSWIVQLLDPQGAMFAIVSMQR